MARITPPDRAPARGLPWTAAAGAFAVVLVASASLLGFLTGWTQPGKVVTAEGRALPPVAAITHDGRFEPLMPREYPPPAPPPPLEMTASQVPSLRNVATRAPDPDRPPPTITAVLDIRRASLQTVPMSPTGMD